jgi:RES domain-containing protein
LDRSHPDAWSSTPFPLARWRFDSAAGAHRCRYAASSERGMLREAFDPDRYIAAESLQTWVVTLTLTGSALDLRTHDTLDAFGLDDQISTSRDPRVWQAAQRLGDLHWARHHDRDRLPGIVYRSRTTPQHNANLAWFSATPATVTSAVRLGDRPDLLEAAITADGFTVEL